MTDLFAILPVSDFAAARPWYERLFGGPPAFVAHETESVWQIGKEGYIAVNEDPDRAGRSYVTIFAKDLDEVIGAIGSRGLVPADSERYANGVRKAIFRDSDGNEVGYAGAPDES